MAHPYQNALEALFNLASGGVLDRIDSRAKRARELRQWGLHPHHPEPGSSLAADDAAFLLAYPSRSQATPPSPKSPCFP